MLGEGRVDDADVVGRYVQYLLIIGCLMHFSTSLLRASKEIVEHRMTVRIPAYRFEELFKAFKNSIIFSWKKYGQLYVCLPLLSLISSFIFLFLGDLEKAAFLFYATCLLILVMIIMQLLRPIALPERQRYIIRIPAYVLRECFNRKKIRAYVSENPGAPFILGFQFLLILCVALLIKGAEAIANELAVYAYYALLIGVLLQIVSYIKERRRKGS
ncbi:MAG: hypothetical protein QXT87_06130 [Thermoproteota archaeon]